MQTPISILITGVGRGIGAALIRADARDIVYPMAQPESFDSSDFRIPDRLFPVRFRPLRIALHWLQRPFTS